METFLITGGAGFIGSHLADALLSVGHAVRVLDDFSTGRAANLDRRCEVIEGDVRDRGAVRDAMMGVSGCFHLAAIASVARANEDWLGTHQVNLGGAINVFDVSRELGRVPVVYASSAAVYGRTSGIAQESSPTSPLTAYGADKRGCELHAAAGATVHGVPSMGFRFFNVYGPRQDPHSPYSGVISIFAKASATGAAIRVHGAGQQTRDFIHVDDVVRFLISGMTWLTTHRGAMPPQSVLNVCTGQETSIIELARVITRLMNSGSPIEHGPARPGDIERSVGSPELGRATLGTVSRVSLQEGLRHTLGAFRQYVVSAE